MVTDLLFVLRQLRARPGYTAVAVLTLALGTGAATAMFSVVDHVLLRPLPFPDAGRLVALCETHASIEGLCVTSPPVSVHVRDLADRALLEFAARLQPQLTLEGCRFSHIEPWRDARRVEDFLGVRWRARYRRPGGAQF